MRAFVRVIPLLVVAAHVASCAANNMASGGAGPAGYAAAATAARPAVRKPAPERPSQALLARQPSPQCERAKPPEGVPPEQARTAMLDYEQQCYRQLASLAHARLAALQGVAAKTRSFDSQHRALLEPQPSPHCEPAKPPAGASPAEAREAMLDGERQCYKQLEASRRQQLDALQDALRKPADTARGQGGAVHRVRPDRYLTY